MENGTTFVGLDVHVKTIAVAVAHGDGEIEAKGIHPNTPKVLERVLRRIGPLASLSVCYEAGPCGYSIYRQLTGLGIRCMVVAPSLLPKPVGKRIKTDRLDAAFLARTLRSGEVAEVTAPTPELEALRDLSRARQVAVEDLQRARQRLIKLLHRKGIVEPAKPARWLPGWWSWAKTLSLPLPAEQTTLTFYRDAIVHAQERVDHLTLALRTLAASTSYAPVIEALDDLHGIGVITALGLVAEIGDFRRFDNPRQLMAYAGMVPSEHSSGGRQRRGSITKTGNAHVRRLLVEAAWHYTRPLKADPTYPNPNAEEARTHLLRRYRKLVGRGKPRPVAVVAIARELLGFVWDAACQASAKQATAAR
jgi:transposase